ncbi:type II toxin-antitoxin system VapC family toxin [Phreatobacter oligotrophus]|jgi:predicted nucleic-acid-binding protein|uniref:Putative nucleic-acid-binding protein n=1 Tax=Phreatobacter oligotrophus TaxID=1122261 RepID=A0A2T4ZGB7_9HYPH|nr:type II toxin-antitoxin system VapC family toxin [Phreatobacter oligotrophus]PTM60936.1 putative nucleic-acid-binding protein [Phreatobacter oligotrophus]
MDAIDTNILVRLIIRDDEAMYQRAAKVLSSGPILVPTTVLLEAEWVLRDRYGLDREAVADSLTAFLGLPDVETPMPEAIHAALNLLRAGLDFADALHLSTAAPARRFVTLDVPLARRAQRLATPTPVSLA